MALDIDYIFGKQVLTDIEQVLDNTPHGERKEITDKIITFAESIGITYKKAEPVPIDTELTEVLKKLTQ